MARKLSPQVLELLELVADQPCEDKRGQAIAKLFGMTTRYNKRDSLGVAVIRLEEKGLLERHITGRRTYSVKITEAGLKALGRQVPVVQAEKDTLHDLPTGPASSWLPALAAAETVVEEVSAPVELVRDGVDYEVLAGVLLKKCLVAMRAEEEGASVQQLRTQLFDAQQAERAAKARTVEAEQRAQVAEDALAGAKGQVFELQAELAVMTQNNEVLVDRLDIAERKLGVAGKPKVRDLLSTEEIDSLNDFQRQLAKVMVQPPSAKG